MSDETILTESSSTNAERFDANDDREQTVSSRIAFGSCHKSLKASNPPIWESILPIDSNESHRLDAWLWLGDAMYPSHRDPVTKKKYYAPAPLSEVEAGFTEMKEKNATIGYKDFLHRLNRPRKTSVGPLVSGVWDDHDFGANDMGSRMPAKRDRKKIFCKFLGAQDGEGKCNLREGDGMYHRVDMEGGKIRILVLDTRWFREDHCIPSVAYRMPMGNAVACLTRWLTSGLLLHKYAWIWRKGGCEHAKVLGEEQWKWLENELLGSGSTEKSLQESPELFVILSSIQVWSTNPVMEGWGHFPTEQKRLWNLLREHYSRADKDSKRFPAPVIFLSGDVHHGEISGQEGYYELTSSGLTHHCGQHKLYGPICEPILRTFSDHRPGIFDETNKDGEAGKDRYYIGLNYGVLEILDNDAGFSRKVRAQIRNANGETVLEVVQPLGEHAAVPALPPYERLAHTMDGHLIPYAKALGLLAMIGLASLRLLLFKMR